MNSSKHSSPKTRRRSYRNRWSNNLRLLLALVILSVPFSVSARETGNIFYMSPQGEYKQWMDNGVAVAPTNDRLDLDLRRTSPDNKRWFAITYSLVSLGAAGQRLDYHIQTYANKDHLTRITLFDVLSDGVPEVRWLNDKLLYIEFWWRSTVGGYLIYDTDNEYIVGREMMFVGAPPQVQNHPRLTPGKGYFQ